MNSIRLLLLLFVLLFLASSAWAKPLRNLDGSANGNLHDFSSTNNNHVSAVSDTRVCIFCHTPHSSSSESVLWNRGFPANFGSFQMYLGSPGGVAIRDDATIKSNSGYGGADYPNGASRMCLSCHDGATALNNVITGGFIAMTYFSLDDYITPGVNDGLSVDLSVSHPISFRYDGTLPADINTFNGGGYQAVPLALQADVPLDPQGRMQCTTCHDPHDDNRDDAGIPPIPPFWRYESAADPYNDVCDACHSSVAPALGGGTIHTIP